MRLHRVPTPNPPGAEAELFRLDLFLNLRALHCSFLFLPSRNWLTGKANADSGVFAGFCGPSRVRGGDLTPLTAGLASVPLEQV